MVQATINGHGPYWFLVDTGSPDVSIRKDYADRLGLKKDPKKTGYFVGSGSYLGTMAYRSAETLTVGNVIFKGIDISLCHPEMFGDEDPDLIGVLGLRLFYDTQLTFDYRNIQLIIEPGELSRDKYTMPIIPLGKWHLGVPVHLGNRRLILALDTGMTAGVELTVPPPPEHYEPLGVAQAKTFFGIDRSLLVRYKQPMRIGPHTVKAPLISLPESSMTEAATPNDAFWSRRSFPIIGADILRHFKVTIDQRRNRIRLYRESDQPIEMPVPWDYIAPL